MPEMKGIKFPGYDDFFEVTDAEARERIGRLEQAKENGELTGPQGETGATGPQGPQGEKGETGADGKDGSNGVSASHSWNGTTLTITSASGTSSADLKGAKGDKGDPGENGNNGTSVSVKSVSESSTDGGSNVVTFSDGKTVTIKNGSKGSTGATGAAGKTPVKGTDYWTAADKAEMVNAVIAALPVYNGEVV